MLSITTFKFGDLQQICVERLRRPSVNEKPASGGTAVNRDRVMTIICLYVCMILTSCNRYEKQVSISIKSSISPPHKVCFII